MSGRHVTRLVLLVTVWGLLLTACGEKQGTSSLKQVTFEEGLSPEQIEQQHSLTEAGRAELTPENVETLKQWQVDQLYARLTSGPIPDGVWQGRFFFAEGGGPNNFADAIGGLKGGGLRLSLPP
ncbi:hypothetical protein C2W62_44095, partial [Candidatus Entotheonella serta]